METTALSWLTVLAILIGPIAAVQVQKWIELIRTKNANKLSIFKTLMATRTARISFEHVRALNMIDLDFYGDTKIIEAWKIYRDHLNSISENPKAWISHAEDLLTDLLYVMAENLKYYFDKVDLKKGIYAPIVHSELANDIKSIRKHALDYLSGKTPINVKIVASE